MTKQTDCIVGLSHQDIRGRKTHMIDALCVQVTRKIKERFQCSRHELVSGNDRRIIIQ